jgi:peptidoglycan/LPS O-acetylase OafA/YrhL
LHLITLFLFLPMEALKFILPSQAAPAFSINSFPALLSNLLLMQSWHLHHSVTWNHPAWSISAEWAAYLLFPWLVPLVLRAGRFASWVLAVALLAGIMELTLAAGHGELAGVMSDFGVIRCLLGFTLGMQIYRLWRANGRGDLRAWAGSWVSLATALIAVGTALHFKAFDPLIILLFGWLILAASSGDSALHRLISMEPMRYLGVISYSIYMDHAVVQRAWRFIWQRWADGVYGTTASLVTLAFLLAAVLALASLTYRFIERPGRVALARWFSRAGMAVRQDRRADAASDRAS